MKYCPSCRTSYPLDYTTCPEHATPLQLVTDLTPGLVLRGKYEILEKLGAGGMGAVYKAKHVAFGELRAIKFVSSHLLADAAILARFRSEAVVARRLQHPNAVRVEDLDTTEDGRPFIVMEYVLGRSLRDVFYDAGELPLARILDLGRQACRGLGAAHDLGIVHRDIKPDNMLVVTQPDGGDLLKVADFGLAKVRAGFDLADGQLPTQTGMLLGTPPYMSPEQAGGEEIDGRSDLYSVGIVLYELVTGRLPFRADTPLGMLAHHRQTPPQPPLELGAPEPLSRFLLKALAKDRNVRFQTAAEMEIALGALGATKLPLYAGDGIVAGFDPEWVGSRRASQIVTRQTPGGGRAHTTLPPRGAGAEPVLPSAETQQRKSSTRAARVTAPASPSATLWIGLAVAAVVGVFGYAGLARRSQPSPSPPAPTSPQAAAPAPAPSVSGTPQASDDGVRAEIEGLLSSSSALRRARILVEVRNGIVTLSGEASSPTTAELAASLARSANGVRQVFSTLRVAAAAAAPPTTVPPVSAPPVTAPAPTMPPATAPATAPSPSVTALPTNAAPPSTLGQPPGRRPPAATPATERRTLPDLLDGPAPPAGRRGSADDEAVRKQVRALLDRAKQNLDSGRPEAAVPDFEAVLRLDPNNVAARDALQKLRSRLPAR